VARQKPRHPRGEHHEWKLLIQRTSAYHLYYRTDLLDLAMDEGHSRKLEGLGDKTRSDLATISFCPMDVAEDK
jgi:hypothetical protein